MTPTRPPARRHPAATRSSGASGWRRLAALTAAVVALGLIAMLATLAESPRAAAAETLQATAGDTPLAAGAEPPAGAARPAAASQAPAIELPDNPLLGRTLFESKHCVRCHGIAATAPSIGPTLGEGRFAGTFLELGAALWNHVPGMTVSFEVTGLDWPEISGRQATQLISFLYFVDYLGRPGVASAGRRIFESKGCSSCHNIGGGDIETGPDLAELRRFASPLSVAQEIWNHGPSMLESMRRMDMSPPQFDDGDLADLSAFIRQQAGPGPRQPLLSAPGNPNRGRGLFASKGCSSCHGSAARGGRGGPDLTEFDLRRSADAIAGTMWNHALGMRDAMSDRGIAWPQLEGSDLADVVAFLYFLAFIDPPGDRARGAEVFADRSCSACHPGDTTPEAAGSFDGPDLAGADAVATPAALVAAMWNHAPLMKEVILRQGRPWPELTGRELRDLRAYLEGNRQP